MNQQKEKYFQRQHNRFMKAPPRKELIQSAESKNTASEPQAKEEAVTQSFAIKTIEQVTEEKTPFSLASNTQDNLRRLLACSKSDFESLIRDKLLRQDLKKQQRRLIKVRNDNKLTVETDTELSITAINGIITLTEEYINDVNKQKAEKMPPKTAMRVNQEKEIAKQLKTIDEQIELSNFASVKSTIQILLKKYGKDELLQEKLGYLNFMLTLNDQYQREANVLKDLSLYVQKLSSIDITPQTLNQNSVLLKNLKKQTTLALNKENKKQQPSERTLTLISQVDKIGGLLSNYIDSKTEKKVVETKTKRQIQLEKQLQEKMKSSQFLEESSRYCRQILQRTTESKEELFKQLETLKKNKKKSAEAPYNLLLKVYDNITAQKRQINEINMYLKACSQFYIRKNLNAENLGVQLKKLDQKYITNEILSSLKLNLDVFVSNVQERERFNKQVSAAELQLKKSKAEILRLEKLIEQKGKLTESVEVEKIDKRKELEQKRAREAQRLKQDKEDKEIERSLDNIFNNLQEKKWKAARNSINLFSKKYEESTNPIAVRSLLSLNIISNISQDLQSAEAKVIEVEKRQKSGISNLQKEKQTLNQKIKSSEEYQMAIKNLIENFNLEGFTVKKYFDDLRRDRKKIVQERYQLINKLEDPIIAYRQAKLPEVSERVSLSLSSMTIQNEAEQIKKEKQQLAASLDKEKEKSALLESRLKESSKSPEINKDAEELLNLVKRIQKGGQWWKFLPKNLKNSNFKHIYNILEKYRENELILQSQQVFLANQELLRQEAVSYSNALDSAISVVRANTDFFVEQFWGKYLANFRGSNNSDKLIACLSQLTAKAFLRVEEERNNYKIQISSYQKQIQNLSNAINDLQKRKDSQTERSSSKLEDSSAKKSPELKSSRRAVSRSKQKEREGQVKQAMQEFVQQQRRMLSKIEQLEGEKQNIEAKAAAIQNELIHTERRLEDQRIDFQTARFAAQKIRLQQLQRINELEGELEISEGRRIQMQNKLEIEINTFREVEKQLTSKLYNFQTREAQHQEQLKSRDRQANNESVDRLTSELNYYRQMYGELSKELQLSKEKEQNLIKDFETLRKSNQILEVKYQADMVTHQPIPISSRPDPQQSPAKEEGSLKMKPYKINLHTEKIFELQLQEDVIKPKEKVLKKEAPAINITPEPSKDQNYELNIVIQQLKAELNSLKVHQSQQIQKQVIMALKRQEEDFNQFLKRFEAEKYELFMNEILPKRLQEELATRDGQKANEGYEFMHNEWIINQFPRLYDERHNRQCSKANIDIEAIVSRRLEEIGKSDYQEKRAKWEEETNKKVEANLIEFQQNTVPLIIEQHYRQWQQTKAKELEQRTWEVEQYWKKILEEEKQLAQTSSESSPQPQIVKVETHHEVVYRQPNELEILAIMRKESSKSILEALLAEQFNVWEDRKAEQWVIKRKQIDDYWQNTVLPEKYEVWQHEKEKEISQKYTIWLEENDKKWNQRLNQVIITQRQAYQLKTESISSQDKSTQIIERWKIDNMPGIVQGERRFAIEKFIQIDLPHIIEEQRLVWVSRQAIPDVDHILNEEHKRWEEEKAKQIAFINSSFDARINEILQFEHIEWQKNKVIEFQKRLAEEQTNWTASSPNIEEILNKEHQHWELVKLEQIRSLELEFETRLNEIERKLNSQIIDYQQKFLKEQNRQTEVEAAAILRWKNNELPILLARERQSSIAEFKSKELPKIIQVKYRDWEAVDLIQLIHSEKNHYIIDNIVSQRNKDWEKEVMRQNSSYEKKIFELQQSYEKQLIVLKQSHERANKTQAVNVDELQRQKGLEIQTRIKEVQHYWETVILPQRLDSWRKEQAIVVEELLSSKIADIEAAYHENFIPKIIEEQWNKWRGEYLILIEKEKEQWLTELPSTLKTGKLNQYIQPFLDSQASQYELQIKRIQAESISSNIKIEQLTNQIGEYESRLREGKTKYELAQSKVKSLLSEHDVSVKRTIEESQRLNEELTRSRWAEKEVEELRKIIEMQKSEVIKLTAALRESQRFKLENINLQEANSNLQKAKWQQINELRSSYETKIIEATSERNSLMAKVSQLQAGRKENTDKDSLLSFERQISILNSTLKTKDAELAFLKKTVESVNAELRENREKLNDQLEKRGISERLVAEMRSNKLQLDYEIKYLKDREESFIKKLELKEQEMLSLKKKIDIDNDSLEKKLKSSLDYASSYQVKFTELESLLTFKTKESQTLMVEIDRLRYENQGLSANCQGLNADAEQLKRQIRDLQTQKTQLTLEKERNLNEASRLKQSLSSYEEELKRSSQNTSRLTAQFTTQKLRLESEIKRSREQILHLEIELKDSERIKRIQIDRAAKLERELAVGGREVELGEIEVLKKINRDVSDLTAANRQLEMKCMLLENKEKITPSSSEVINSFLLIQKHTDLLLDYLLKQSIVPNLEIYHKFLSESRTVLAAGRSQEYFDLWEKMLRDLFQLTIACRSEEIRSQAEELLRLRDEMTDVLERQIEVSEGDQTQLVEDYKQVMSDIKSLVREYLRSGDDEYLRLLCSSLGIPI